MRHMIVNPRRKGRHRGHRRAGVENPTDKSWLGTADASGKRATFVVNLPPGATDVQLGGAFHECCVTVENGRATNSMALLPGVTKYQLNYNLPAINGKAELTATMPALVKNMIIMLPDDGSAASADGLEGPSTVNMGNGKHALLPGSGTRGGNHGQAERRGIRDRRNPGEEIRQQHKLTRFPPSPQRQSPARADW
jgi:hypothetical protein